MNVLLSARLSRMTWFVVLLSAAALAVFFILDTQSGEAAIPQQCLSGEIKVCALCAPGTPLEKCGCKCVSKYNPPIPTPWYSPRPTLIIDPPPQYSPQPTSWPWITPLPFPLPTFDPPSCYWWQSRCLSTPTPAISPSFTSLPSPSPAACKYYGWWCRFTFSWPVIGKR